MPDGLGSLAPADGRIPVETLGSLADDIEATAAAARGALDTVRATPDTLPPSTVADARFEAEEQTARLSRSLVAAAVMVRRLPEFAGADGARRYLLIAESPRRAAWHRRHLGRIRRHDRRRRASPSPRSPNCRCSPRSLLTSSSSEPRHRENYDEYGGAGPGRT